MYRRMSHQLKKNLGVTLYKNGAEFRVWAPFAVNVQIGGTFTPDGPVDMTKEPDGYWSIKIKDVEPGQQYKYYIETLDGTILEKNDCLNNRLGEIVVPVKMPVTRSRTERPHGALL